MASFGGILMAMRWCYIGELGPGSKLDWGGPEGGNIPIKGPLPDCEDLRLYQAISFLARDGQFEGAIIDFDAYGLRLNGHQLRRVLENCYKGDPSGLKDPVIKQYLEYGDALGEDHFIALVAVAL
jgi:hypothetical protein